MQTIADSYHVSYKSLESFISKEYTEFLVSKESHALYNAKNQFDNLRRPKDINEEFMELVENGAALAYAQYYAMTNDNHISLKESGLLVGIAKQRGKDTKVTKGAEKLRGLYLRSIPQVSSEIKKVRADLLADSPISKVMIQSELITQLEELKEIVADDPRQRSNLIKVVELTGRSIGAFSDRIEVSEITPDKALDTLIEMAKIDSTYEDIDDE